MIFISRRILLRRDFEKKSNVRQLIHYQINMDLWENLL